MAPIILVDGNNESPDFFGPTRFNFEHGLKDVMAPYSLDVDMPVDSVTRHGAVLKARVPLILQSFGVQHFHVIAHSKGGLDSREYFALLGRDGSPAVVPLSLVTLCTPHSGSPGADYGCLSPRGSILALRQPDSS